MESFSRTVSKDVSVEHLAYHISDAKFAFDEIERKLTPRLEELLLSPVWEIDTGCMHEKYHTLSESLFKELNRVRSKLEDMRNAVNDFWQKVHTINGALWQYSRRPPNLQEQHLQQSAEDLKVDFTQFVTSVKSKVYHLFGQFEVRLRKLHQVTSIAQNVGEPLPPPKRLKKVFEKKKKPPPKVSDLLKKPKPETVTSPKAVVPTDKRGEYRWNRPTTAPERSDSPSLSFVMRSRDFEQTADPEDQRTTLALNFAVSQMSGGTREVIDE